MNYNYSKGFKKMAVKKMLNPATKNITYLCKKLGISRTSIYKWKKELLEEDEIEEKSPRKWKLDRKFEAFLKAANEGKDDIGKWLRHKGLKSIHIKKWSKELKLMINNDKNRINELEKENKELRKKLKKLEKLINKKNKTIAEMKALEELKKKYLKYLEEEGIKQKKNTKEK